EKQDKLSSEAIYTAKLCLFMDKLFDINNSSTFVLPDKELQIAITQFTSLGILE
ncbi:Hypothetical protein CINCED_3A001114, partial [Cinara cedri]